jgi:hypothetical protein
MTAISVGTPCLDGATVDPRVMAEQAGYICRGVHFDTMVGTGMSGALVVPVLARELGKHWMILRKPGDAHKHHSAPGEGSLGNHWLFVDDGIMTGETVQRVRREVGQIARSRGHMTRFAGAYCYGDHDHDRYRASRYFTSSELDEMLRYIRA